MLKNNSAETEPEFGTRVFQNEEIAFPGNLAHACAKLKSSPVFTACRCSLDPLTAWQVSTEVEMALDILTRLETPADEREYLSWLKLPFQTECDLMRAEHIDSAWFHTLSVQPDLSKKKKKK